jgi:hypothetical protein
MPDHRAVKRALLVIAASAAVYAIATWWAASQLPEDRVAMQINTAGEVNQYATRAGAISYFVGLGAFLLVLAIAAVCLCWWVPVRFLNFPNKKYWMTPERAPFIRRMVTWDAAVILSMPLLALSFIPVNVALLSQDPAGASELWILAPIGVWLAAMTCYVIWMYARRYRPRSSRAG